MFKNAVLIFTLLVSCTKSQPAQTTPPPAASEAAPASEPAPSSEAAADPSVPSTPPPSTPAKASPNKCAQNGGRCNHRTAMNVCKGFKEGAEWGCGPDQGCCFN